MGRSVEPGSDEEEIVRQAVKGNAYSPIAAAREAVRLMQIRVDAESENCRLMQERLQRLIDGAKGKDEEIERLKKRLDWRGDTVEGIPTGQGEDEIDRLNAEIASLRGLLADVQDHGRRTVAPLGPEAADLIARIDAEIGSTDSALDGKEG